jgi:hypothetical protein
MTSQTVGLSWIQTAAENVAYQWLEQLAPFNTPLGTGTPTTPAGNTAQTYHNAGQLAVTNYLNSVSPWGNMQRIQVLPDGTITTRYGERCYDDSPSGVLDYGNAMWYLPAYWYWTYHKQTTDDVATYRWFMSPTGSPNDVINQGSFPADVDTGTLPNWTSWPYTPTWKLHPAYIRNGINEPWIALGTYEGYQQTINGVSQLTSQTGVVPTGSQTITQFRTLAKSINLNLNWGIQDYLATTAVQLPYLIEYGGFNSQLLLGGGYSNVGSITATGNTASSGNTSVGTSNNYLTPVSFHGLENLYGNQYKFLDGLNLQGGNTPWIADHNFAVNTFSGTYNNTTFSLPTTNGAVISDIYVTSQYDYGFLPSAVAGTSTTKLCDVYGYTSNASGLLVYGGPYTYSINGGVFGLVEYPYTESTLAAGARLMFIPQ